MKNNHPDLTPDKISDPADRLLTIAEVAEACQCSEKTVRQWITDCKISYVSLGNETKITGLTRIRESSLIKFWRKNERKATP